MSFIACDKKQEEPVDSWYYEKTEMKTDGQLYNEGEVQFPSSLWETPEYERYDQLDNGASKGYFIKSVQGTWVF